VSVSSVWSVFIVSGALAVAAFLTWLWWSLRPVQRREVERFVWESGLVLTVENGSRIVDVIARTRFWRVVGVVTSLAVFVLLGVVEIVADQSLTVSLLMVLGVLIGYYVGSVVAEFRTARRVVGPGLRSASIAPRDPEDYIGGWARRWPLVLGVTGVGAAVVAVAAGNRDLWLPAAGLGAGVVAVTTALITRYVLERPQSTEAADLRAADDAIRSRSLHVLAGSAVGIQLWLASLAVGGMILSLAAHVAASRTAATVGPVVVLFAVVIPLGATVVGRRLSRRAFPLATHPVEVTA
jgi:hypothetical protein